MKDLRKLVMSHADSDWFKEHEEDIIFELNHLELHDLDEYVYSVHQKGIKVSNPNNSNVAFLIGITDQEPNSRITTKGGSFPDIDIDFEHTKRDQVVDHLKDVYGDDCVSGIGTFMFPKAKGVFKDTARIFHLPFAKSNEISKLIPDMCESLSDALEDSPDLRKMYESDEEIQKIIDYAQNLEGTVRSVGKHACGYVIGTEPLTNIIPLFESKGEVVTQFDGPTLEKIGLIKFDILGLKNLTVISKTLELVKKTKGEEIDIDAINLDDQNAYDIISTGNSLGVFQIEGSKGLRDFAAACKPKNLEDISAIISLYRPGPMGLGYLEEYIRRKNDPTGDKNFSIPKYDYLFDETYGLMIYQEQLMKLAQDMCGYNDIETDVLRKAVGKKDRELLESQKKKFVDGAVKNGEDQTQVEKLWDGMSEFAR